MKAACPTLVIGCLSAEVMVEKSNNDLRALLNAQAEEILKQTTQNEIIEIPNIKAARNAYKNLKKDPHRYRISSEALIRRIVQGKGLYYINNVVEINNVISILSGHSVGSYDLSCLKPPVVLTVGGIDERYEGIGKESVNIENMPVLRDQTGYFGSPTSDSKRAMITQKTTKIMMVIFAFGGKDGLLDYLSCAKELFEKYAQGKQFEIKMIE